MVAMKAGNEIFENQIYKNAWKLLGQYGLKGWNMDDLAQSSGIAKNTLYKIVGNKETLLSKIVLDLQEEYIAFIENTACSNDPIKSLYEFIEELPKILYDYNILVIQQIRIRYPRLSQTFNKNEQRITNALIVLYNNAQNCGLLRDDIDLEFFVALQQLVRDQIILQSRSPEDLASNLKKALLIIVEGMLRRSTCSP